LHEARLVLSTSEVRCGGGLELLVDPVPGASTVGRVVVYARVSSAGQREDVERQAGRVVTGATDQGLSVDQVASEIGSGMSGHRPQADPGVVGPGGYGHRRGASGSVDPVRVRASVRVAVGRESGRGGYRK
jgi:hypothetical protein